MKARIRGLLMKSVSVSKFVTSVFYHGLITLFGILMIYPVLWMIFGSFKNNSEILTNSLALLPEAFRFENYAAGWAGFGKITFGTFFLNSFWIALIATVGTTASSAMVAYAFARIKFKFRKFWFACMIGSLMLPYQVIMIPQYVMFNNIGLVGSYLPLLLPHFLGTPFFIFMMMQFIAGLPKELDEAAIIDGCSKYSVFTRIMLPLLSPALITTIIIQFYWKWDDFMAPLIYISKPAKYTVSVALRMFIDSQSVTNYGSMLAMSTLSLIPVFLIFLFFNKNLIQGIGTSGLKA